MALIAGTADQSVLLQVYNEDGTEKTDLAFNTSGLVCYYKRGPTGTATAITLATQTATGAHADGGFVAVDATNMPGLYRLDLPDAAVAAGVDRVWVTLSGVATVGVCTLEIDLPAYDPYAAPASTVTLADGGITAAKIASDAITAAKLASDAITEIQNGLATSAALAIVDTNVDDIETAVASLATAANLAALDAKVDILDTNVDTLLTSDVVCKKGVARNVSFYMEATDGTPGTSLTVTVEISKDHGAFASPAGSVTEVSDGWYWIPLTGTEMNADEINVKATATGAKQRNFTIWTQS